MFRLSRTEYGDVLSSPTIDKIDDSDPNDPRDCQFGSRGRLVDGRVVVVVAIDVAEGAGVAVVLLVAPLQF